jgi:F-type H+-transporting ATPase subunit delta
VPKTDVASRRYAAALLDVAGSENLADRCLADIDNFNIQANANAELARLFRDPTVPAEAVARVVHTLATSLGLAPLSVSFLALLAQRRRMDRLDSIVAAYRDAQDRKAGRARGELVSAGPLTPAQAERIRDSVGSAIGLTLQLEEKQDPALLSGVQVTVGDRVYDLSARTYLDSLRSHLLENR